MFQFFQKEGKNKTSTANNSSLPSNIPKDKLNFEKVGKVWKFPLGPTISPKPGPTLDIAVAAPDTAVTKSKPFKDNNVANIKKMKKYIKMKVIIEYINVLLIFSLLYFIGKIP